MATHRTAGDHDGPRSILRGAKPGDLPVQFPTKFEMVVNLKTAKALAEGRPQEAAALRSPPMRLDRARR
jgi:hypothetical protein